MFVRGFFGTLEGRMRPWHHSSNIITAYLSSYSSSIRPLGRVIDVRCAQTLPGHRRRRVDSLVDVPQADDGQPCPWGRNICLAGRKHRKETGISPWLQPSRERA